MPLLHPGGTCRRGDNMRLWTRAPLSIGSTAGAVETPRVSGELAKSSADSALRSTRGWSTLGLDGREFGVLEWYEVQAGYEHVLQAPPLAWLASFTDSSINPN